MEEMEYTTMEEEFPVSDPISETMAGEEFEAEIMNALDDSGVEYMSTMGDPATGIELTGAEAAGVMAFLGAYMVFMFVILAIVIVAMWKIFTKMGLAGWKSLIPFYSSYLMLQKVGRPGWWLLLFFIPFVNIVIAFLFAMDLAKSFGRSTVFGVVGLFFFSLIGYLILAFGKDVYVGPGETSSSPQAPAPTEEVVASAA